MNIFRYYNELYNTWGPFFYPKKKEKVSYRVQMGIQSSSGFPFDLPSPAPAVYYVNEAVSFIMGLR